jgi:Kef-type K+ transport system membrane component KefB
MDVLKSIEQQAARGPVLAFFVLFLALVLGPRVAERLRLPAMVGLVLAGTLVGPHGFKLLRAGNIALSSWGDFGLLYLMFAAGLELDLKLFARMKKAALTFAFLAFTIPFALGIASAHLLGYTGGAAVLMGSNWGSYTLVTYPILRKMGLARNHAVATVVGATAVTDTTALLVLTGVTASVRKGGRVGVEVAEIAIGLAVLVGWSMVALPKITRWFFARVGTDASYRFVFGMMAFLTGAVMAQAAGIDGIVGAFFAGLGVNRAIPEESLLMERVQFFGSGLFIPIFLVSVGILLDPKVLADPKTLLVALVFTIAALGGKAIAAAIAGRRSGFSWPQAGVMWGLSGSQAAATLATTLVGARLGLFDKQTINAVLVVILVSLVVTPATVTFFAKKIDRTQGDDQSLAGMVLVPVWDEATRPLLKIAGRLAESDGGIVLAASFATVDAPEAEMESQRALKDQAEEWLARDGLESRTFFRVSRSVPAGLIETVRAEKATLVIAQWRSTLRDRIEADSEALHTLKRTPVPVLVANGAIERFERIVVLGRREDLVRPGKLALELVVEIVSRIAGRQPVVCVGPLVALGPAPFSPKVHVELVDHADSIAWARDHVMDTDLLLLSGIDAAEDAFERLPGMADRKFLIAVAAHMATASAAEDRSTGLVAGQDIPLGA